MAEVGIKTWVPGFMRVAVLPIVPLESLSWYVDKTRDCDGGGPSS